MSDLDKVAVTSKEAPAAIGPYSQAIWVGDLLFASGQVPIDPATEATLLDPEGEPVL